MNSRHVSQFTTLVLLIAIFALLLLALLTDRNSISAALNAALGENNVGQLDKMQAARLQDLMSQALAAAGTPDTKFAINEPVHDNILNVLTIAESFDGYPFDKRGWVLGNAAYASEDDIVFLDQVQVKRVLGEGGSTILDATWLSLLILHELGHRAENHVAAGGLFGLLDNIGNRADELAADKFAERAARDWLSKDLETSNVCFTRRCVRSLVLQRRSAPGTYRLKSALTGHSSLTTPPS